MSVWPMGIDILIYAWFTKKNETNKLLVELGGNMDQVHLLTSKISFYWVPSGSDKWLDLE